MNLIDFSFVLETAECGKPKFRLILLECLYDILCLSSDVCPQLPSRPQGSLYKTPY